MICGLKKIVSVPHLLLVLIFLGFLLPSRYALQMRIGLKNPLPFAIVLVVSEILYALQLFSAKNQRTATDIFTVVYGFLLAWEYVVSRLNLLPYVFVPAPENVFTVFKDDWRTILAGFASSMQLLAVGIIAALVCATVLGTVVGYNRRLSKVVYPIAKAISTVPALIYTPYIVLIMPTFKLASLTVIFLSIFWGAFMGAINNTSFVEKRIINSARVLTLPTKTILFKIIIPFNMPRIVDALPIHLATALMTLTVAEMLGADSGMGYYVRTSLNYASYTKAIAGIIFIGVVVTILNSLIQLFKKRFIKWSY